MVVNSMSSEIETPASNFEVEIQDHTNEIYLFKLERRTYSI